jgi:hypothetical protein
MNEKIKKKWLKALRSGKYKQSKTYLRTIPSRSGESQYCCLGVLCDLYQQTHPTTSAWREHGLSFGFEFWTKKDTDDTNTYILSEEVKRWSGLTNAAHIDQLIRANDRGESFEYIADLIEVKAFRNGAPTHEARY